MEAVAGPGAAGGAIASLARRGRGDLDADSMGYDEVYLHLMTDSPSRKQYVAICTGENWCLSGATALKMVM